MIIPKNISNLKIKTFFKKTNLQETLYTSSNYNKLAYKPVQRDLYFLYKIINIKKRLKILEFGTGYSSLVLSLALKENFDNYKNLNFKNIGVLNPFSYSIIDDQKKFIKISKDRIRKFDKRKIITPKFHYSKCSLVLYNDIYCNSYSKLPNIIPDFIYLDGPDINNIKNNINGINFFPWKYPLVWSSKNWIFLNPGTIIVVDGRSNNSISNNNFQSGPINNKQVDALLYLNEKIVGTKSKKLFSFYFNLYFKNETNVLASFLKIYKVSWSFMESKA